MATIKDIARLSGYSIGTVSRVINNHPDVSDTARKKISEIIEQEQYLPNKNAKNLKQTVGTAIAVVISGHENAFFASLVERIEEHLRAGGEEAAVFYLNENANSVQAAIGIAKERKPKGYIFLGGNLMDFNEDFKAIKVPCVMLTNHVDSGAIDNLSSFSTDDWKAARRAVQYLLDHHHTKIGVIGGSTELSQTSNRRVEACFSLLKDNNISFDVKKQYIGTRYSFEEGYRGAKVLLKQFPELTAIFALSDTIAIGAMRALADSGKRVPEDISIIGYDGIKHGQYAVPRIATIRQDIDILAKRGVEDLLLRIHCKYEPVHELIPFTFVEGESVSEYHG